VVAVLSLGTVYSGYSFLDTKPPEKPKTDEKTSALMRRKLENSQKILEALVTNDLDKASKHSEELLKIRKDPNFKVLKTPEYEIWSEDFTRSVNGIIKASQDKNLEAAKLHYLGMTMSCFNCHTYTRDMRKAS
jgi:hypothetical protein